MKLRTRFAVTAVVAAGILVGGTIAERTRFWRQSNFDEFEKGTAKGVALRSDGKLMLAPRFASVADPDSAYLWSLRADSKGNVYVAGGSNAKVVRVDAQGKSTTAFESTELAAQAIEFDKQDNLYVATSPDGKVYKVNAKGEKSVFFDPKTKYIWDIALDAAGTLYVATGDKGEIFSVAPDGKGQVFYKTEETHVRTLAFDAKGNLVAGTDPSGLILRVEKSATPQGFVLYETARKEITSLLADKSGNIYAAAIGEKPRTPTASQQLLQQAAAAAAAAAAAQAQQPQAAPQQPTPFIPFPATPGGSEVYRIGPDGAPETLWSSRDELVYSLGLSASGKVLLGTGNKGNLIQLEGNGVYSTLAKTSSSQVTGIVSSPGGKVVLCTANPGKIFSVGPDYEPEGTYESQAYDAKIFSQWGRLTWWGDNGAVNGNLQFYVRSGNTSNPEKNWSQWAGPYTDAQGAAVNAPAARFVQWKAVFKAPQGKDASALSVSWVNIAYLPKNVGPVVDHIIPQNPGVRVQGFPSAQSSNSSSGSVQLKMPPAPGSTSSFSTSSSGSAPRFDPPPQGFAQRGAQGVIWSARDENDDDLTYALYYRGESEKEWKLLKDDLQQRYYSWDAGTMPDGAYYLRVVASDAASNPPGEGLTAERISDRFEVDNTPPAIVGLRAAQQSPEVRVTFEAKDSFSAIQRAEISVDAGEWKLAFPEDRTTDAPNETFTLVLKDLAPGEHTIAVRVFDAFENSTSSKVTIVVTPSPKK